MPGDPQETASGAFPDPSDPLFDSHSDDRTRQSSGTTPPKAVESDATKLTAPPPEIPGYDLLAPLGSGGFGEVYTARQRQLDRTVAIKLIRVARRMDAKVVARFEREAVALGRLQHPNIVAVFDAGRCGEQLFIAMELLHGEDLARRLERTVKLDPAMAWAIARQTAAALGHAAERGIFHRDIKPANLFLMPMPTGLGFAADVPLVKVMDFGLALTQSEVTDDPTGRVTAAGTALGTPAYMAPEQVISPDVDHRADIYALGATVYHMLTGATPLAGLRLREVMTKKVLGDMPAFDSIADPAAVALLIDMLAREPNARVASYAELIARIDALTSVAPAVRPSLPKKRRRWPVVLAVLGVIGLAVGGWFAFGSLGSTPPFDASGYVKTGYEEMLYDGQSGLGWVATGGQALTVEEDDEKAQVLCIGRGVKRPFQPFADYRLSVGLDLRTATEVQVWIDGGNDAVPQPAVRIRRTDGAIMGTRTELMGTFAPEGKPVPFPSAESRAGKSPYIEVRLMKAGNRYAAWFDGTLIVSVERDGTGEGDRPALRLLTEGGPIRIESALLEQLVLKR